VENKYS